MSQQNIELVRESLEAFERGDLDGALANAHPDLVSTRVHPDGAVFHGPDGFRQLLADWLEGFSEASFWSGDYIDAGDRVIVHQHQRGRGAGSGALVDGDFWLVYAFAEGKVIRLDIYADKDEALEATGLHAAHQNADLAEQLFDAFNRRDLDAFLALMDVDVQAVPRLAAMEGGYRGHDGIRDWWRTLFDSFPDYTVETVEERRLGNLTLTTLRTRGHGAGSDTPVEDTVWMVAEWRDQKVVRWRVLSTEAEALEAVTGR